MKQNSSSFLVETLRGQCRARSGGIGLSPGVRVLADCANVMIPLLRPLGVTANEDEFCFERRSCCKPDGKLGSLLHET